MEETHANEANKNSALPAESLLAAIVDSSDDAIISKDLNGIITSWNKSAERIFGYAREEIVGASILRLIPPDRQHEETHILERLRRGERVDHFETVRVRRDGTHLNVSLTISPVKNKLGEVIGASKIARDITEQKQAVERLVNANQQLDRANRMKGEFISTLSHELRTPLNAILGWTQIFKGGATPEDIKEGVEIIERNVRSQSQLIEDLLDMGRIEAGKVTLDVQRLDLASVLDTALETVRPTADARSIRLTSAFSNVEGVVMADKNRIQQIVWNLLSNATKFTPKGGRIHVTLERVNSHVEIAVSDNGKGISPKFMEHVFERFSQADSSTTRTFGGLGLGLSIVKHLVELHGGTVRVKSAGINQGSTFIVSLPLVPVRHDPEISHHEERNADVDGAARNVDLHGIRVLAVDDDSDSREILRRILSRAGAEVQTATRMEDAIEIFQTFAPHILLSDIGMPEHDGYELISKIRTLPNAQYVPAVALTALARTEDRTRALRAGFQMHIPKPVDAAELIAVVRNLANLRKPEERTVTTRPSSQQFQAYRTS